MSWTTKHSDKPSDLKRESILTLPYLNFFLVSHLHVPVKSTHIQDPKKYWC